MHDFNLCCFLYRTVSGTLLYSLRLGEPVREVFVTDFGHTWFGSGGVRGAHGVGILLNTRWSYKSFTAISSRVYALDLRLGNHPL